MPPPLHVGVEGSLTNVDDVPDNTPDEEQEAPSEWMEKAEDEDLFDDLEDEIDLRLDDDENQAKKTKEFPLVGSIVKVNYKNHATYEGEILWYFPETEKYQVQLSDGRKAIINLSDFSTPDGMFVVPELPPRKLKKPAKYE